MKILTKTALNLETYGCKEKINKLGEEKEGSHQVILKISINGGTF